MLIMYSHEENLPHFINVRTKRLVLWVKISTHSRRWKFWCIF